MCSTEIVSVNDDIKTPKLVVYYNNIRGINRANYPLPIKGG
jgi:hypothetical protein